MDIETKACKQCGAVKPLTEFYLNRRGHTSRCCECVREGVRLNYRKNREHYVAYERTRANLPHRVQARENYAKTPKGKERHLAARRAWLDRFPGKRAAHVLCGNAIRDGRLIRQPCEVCGHKRTHAHHDDYSKPLDVRWLCTVHHVEWHKHNTPIYSAQEIAA